MRARPAGAWNASCASYEVCRWPIIARAVGKGQEIPVRSGRKHGKATVLALMTAPFTHGAGLADCGDHAPASHRPASESDHYPGGFPPGPVPRVGGRAPAGGRRRRPSGGVGRRRFRSPSFPRRGCTWRATRRNFRRNWRFCGAGFRTWPRGRDTSPPPSPGPSLSAWLLFTSRGR